MAIRPRSFLAPGLPPAANLATAGARRGFGGLASGVGIDLGVEHQDVDVAAAGEDVIEAAVADVVGQPSPPTIQTLFLTSMSATESSCLASGEFSLRSFSFNRSTALTLLENVGLVFLFLREQGGDKFFSDGSRQTAQQFAGDSVCLSIDSRKPRPNSALSSKREWTMPGRGRRRSLTTALSAGCRRRWKSSRSHWRSPNDLQIAAKRVEIGRLAQPEHAPENSNSGSCTCC